MIDLNWRARLRDGTAVTALIAGTAALAAQPAQAQSEEPADAQLEEIVVTAQRKAENLQDTPLAVTAIGGEELAARGVLSTIQLGQNVPGLVLKSTTGTYSSAAFFIRGIGQKSVFNTFDPGVGVYVDDVYIGRTAFGVRNMFDVDRVEVLRGPQGTLYGRNTSGGAIKLVTNAPDPQDAEFGVEAAVGNYERYILQGRANVPLSDTVAVRVSGMVDLQDRGFVRLRTLGGRGNKADTYALRGALRFNPGALDWTIAADWQKLDADGRYGSTLSDGVFTRPDGLLDSSGRYDRDELDVSDSPIPAFNTAREWGLTSNLSYDLGGTVLKSITAYRDFDVDLQLDANNDGFAFGVAQKGHQFTQEFQASGGIGERLNYIVGLFYFRERTSQIVDLGLPLIGVPVQNSASDLSTDAYAVFGQATYSFADNLRLTLGGRYSWEEKEVDVRTLGLFGAPVFSTADVVAAGLPVRREDDSFTPRVALDFDAAENVLISASYTAGFKGGGFQSTAGSVDDFVSFRPEDVDAYEVGVKSEWLGRRLRINLAAYWNDYRDIQLDTIVPPPAGTGNIVQLNVAKARVRGIELETNAIISPAFDLFGFVSFIDDKILDVTQGAAALGTQAGGGLNDVPQWQWQLGANVRVPGSGFSAQVSWAHQDELFNTVTPPSPIQLIEANDIITARLRYEPEGGAWYAQLDCENCLDQRYYVSRLSFPPNFPAMANTPRLVTLRAGIRF